MPILEVEKEGVKVKMLCDGMVCDIAKAISKEADVDELIAAVLREFDHNAIHASWKSYFTVFCDVICKERNKPIVDIARTEIRLCVADIVKHLKTSEKTDGLSFLVMPWNYVANPLESEAEILARKVVEVNSDSVTEKMAEMEKRIDIKNRGYFESLRAEMRSMLSDTVKPSTAPSYSSVTRGAMGPPPPPPSTALPMRGRSSAPSGGQSNVTGVSFNRRDRSQSASKRPRVEEDDPSFNSEVPASNNRSQSKTRKYLVGTLNTKEAAGRKMKSPPGDIFIYGVHPDTTEEDIVNDLKESDIIIETKDVVKKSREGSGLNSYKISVKAEDLQKALDPSIWPMRVKVREYIYYSNKSPYNSGGPQHGGHHGRQEGQGGGQYRGYHDGRGGANYTGAQGGQGSRQYQGQHGYQPEQVGLHNESSYGYQYGAQYGGHHGQQDGKGGGQQLHSQHGEQAGIPTFNRFEGLDIRP